MIAQLGFSCSDLVYDRPTANTIALSFEMLMLLAGSRRRGGCSCRRVGLGSRSGLVPRPAYPYLLPLSSHEATPQHREALPYLCDWEDAAGGWEKKKKPAKMPMCPSPNRIRRKGKKGKGAMSLTLLCTPYYAMAARSLVTSTLAAVEPPATARRTPSRHLNLGGGGNWAATLANNKAGTIYISRHWPSKQDVSWHSYIRSSFT